MESRKHQAQGGVFHGWWILLAASVGLFFCAGPIVGFTFGVFFKPLGQEFDWNRGEISLGFSVCFIAMTLVLPMTGRLIDSFGARKVIVPSVLIFGLCLISFYFLTARLWHFYAIYLIIGIVSGGTATLPYFRVISDWFDKRRGLALGLVMLGYGLGTFFMPILAQALIAQSGWRMAYVYLGVLVVGVTIPVVSRFLKEKPQMLGLLPDGGTDNPVVSEDDRRREQGMSTHEALRTRTFWLIVGAGFFLATSVIGCSVHIVPMLTDRGLSAQSAALAASLTGGAVTLGRVVAGYLLDRYFAAAVAAGFFCATGLGVLLLWGGVMGGVAFVAAFLVGLGNGAEGEILAYLVSRYFGLRAFGQMYGYALASFTLGGVVGPLMMGVGFDLTGSYNLVLGLFLIATLAAAVMMTRLGPYRVWETVATEPSNSPVLGSMTHG